MSTLNTITLNFLFSLSRITMQGGALDIVNEEVRISFLFFATFEFWRAFRSVPARGRSLTISLHSSAFSHPL